MSISRNQRRAGTGQLRQRAGIPGPTRRELPALEWARDMTGQCPRVTAIGSHSLLVENHTGLAGFSEERILLNTRGGPLCVLGSGLELRDVRRDALVIHGSIRRVELPCKGGDAPDEG